MGLKKTLKRKKRGGSWLQSRYGIMANRFRKSCDELEKPEKRFRCKLDKERSRYEAYLEHPYHIYRPENHALIQSLLLPKEAVDGIAVRRWLNEIRKKKYPNFGETGKEDLFLKVWEASNKRTLAASEKMQLRGDVAHDLSAEKDSNSNLNKTKKRKHSDSSNEDH